MFKVEREPTSPGEILDEEFLKPLHITQKQLADHLGCDVKVINRIVNHRTSVTAETAVRLADYHLGPQKHAQIRRSTHLGGHGS
jgi:addiction module HigA family antidote